MSREIFSKQCARRAARTDSCADRAAGDPDADASRISRRSRGGRPGGGGGGGVRPILSLKETVDKHRGASRSRTNISSGVSSARARGRISLSERTSHYAPLTPRRSHHRRTTERACKPSSALVQ